MAPQDQLKAFEIYQAALDLDAAERDTYVAEAVGEDETLGAAVHALLESQTEAERQGFLNTPAIENVREMGLKSSRLKVEDERISKQFGRYKLLRQLGQGGFGTVYLAEQTEPVSRQVALKLIRNDLVNEQFIKRFEAERQVLALLQHPNIAQIYDAGTGPDGEPYLVMEYINGPPITDYCDSHKLGIAARLGLFIQLCDALQHAHQKSVIHRDIKPVNVLVAEQDGLAVPKVIDFGIAKALDLKVNEQTLASATGFMGSPSYMSPEQIEQSGLDIDTRSDVYGLGVLLYELLVGSTPIVDEDDNIVRLLKKVLEQDPVRPSIKAVSRGPSWAKRLEGDLDWIILKALEKDRDRRYNSAAEFAADISRHLNNEAVVARPPTLRYLSAKFVRRHSVGVTASVLILFALIGGIVGTSREAARATAAEAGALEQAEAADQTVQLLLEFLSSADPRSKGRELKVIELLDAFKPRLDQLVERPVVQGSLMYTYASTYLGLGLFAEAGGFAKNAFEIREAQLGNAHPDTLEALILWVDVLSKNGDFEAAENWGRQAIERASASVGDDHPLTLQAATVTATVMVELSQFQEAETLHRATLEKRRRLLGEDHADTLQSMTKLAMALWMSNKLDEAETLNREVLEKRTRLLGPDHPDTLTAMNEVAVVVAEAGRLAEGEVLQRETMEKRQRVLGPDHPDTINAMANLAWVLGEQGKYEAAEQLTRQAWETQKRVLGPNHPDALDTLGILANALTRLDRLSEAEALHQEVWEKRQQIFGPEHHSTLAGLNDLAVMLARQGEFERARVLFEDLVRRHQSALGDRDQGTLRSMGNLAWVLTRQGEYEAAVDLNRETLLLKQQTMGEDHPATLGTMDNLADTLMLAGRYDEAEGLFVQVLEKRQKVLGPKHDQTLGTMAKLAQSRYEQGQTEAATALYRQALELLTKAHGADHRLTVQTREQLDALLATVARSALEPPAE